MLELEKLEDFIWLGRILVFQRIPSRLYLTECDECCCDGASYRLFKDIPKFSTAWRAHPDTGFNRDTMLAKIYSQEIDRIDDLARQISRKVEEISGQEIPRHAKVRRLK